MIKIIRYIYIYIYIYLYVYIYINIYYNYISNNYIYIYIYIIYIYIYVYVEVFYFCSKKTIFAEQKTELILIVRKRITLKRTKFHSGFWKQFGKIGTQNLTGHPRCFTHRYPCFERRNSHLSPKHFILPHNSYAETSQAVGYLHSLQPISKYVRT